ncbi:hypothetical protein WMY93_002894 [Mugilogobius chulae]|uniref:Uncharacterized protein n=1 Tax=Mugilogobius chulae TaxID=88201 RepID=A0AAW0PWP9_9GOBI
MAASPGGLHLSVLPADRRQNQSCHSGFSIGNLVRKAAFPSVTSGSAVEHARLACVEPMPAAVRSVKKVSEQRAAAGQQPLTPDNTSQDSPGAPCYC